MTSPLPATPKKYKINLHCTENGKWYLKSLTINADTKEEFKSILEEARKVIKFGFDSFQENPNTKKIKKPSTQQQITLSNEEIKLFENLKEKRNQIAIEKNVPTYIILNNKTLAHLASKKPNTQEEMLLIPGIGERKFQDYGEIFLNTIKEFNIKN